MNTLILNKVINLVNHNETSPKKRFHVSSLNNFLIKFSLKNPKPHILNITYQDKEVNFMVVYDNDTLKTKIYTLDNIDLVFYHTIIKPKTIEQRINDIVKSTQTILGLQNKQFNNDELNTYIKYLNDIGSNTVLNDQFSKHLKTHLNKCILTDIKKNNTLSGDQHGGLLIKMLEDNADNMESPWISIFLTGILEWFDFTLLIASAFPIIGIPFNIINIIFSILRGDFWSIPASLIDMIPIIGNIIGTIMKLVAKFSRISIKFNKWSMKFSKANKANKVNKQ